MAYLSCSDCLFAFLLSPVSECFWLMGHLSLYIFTHPINLFVNIITIRKQLQYISFQWCRCVWFIILLAYYLTLILGPPLYVTPHYDWSFLLFSFMISAIILISYLVSLLVLDLTAIMHTTSSIEKSLELAYNQGRECGLLNSVKTIFPEPHQSYSVEQYDVFLSCNRLGMSHFFTRNTFLLI